MEETKNTEEFADLSALVDVDDEEGTQGVYELGYHLVSTIPEDGLEAEVAKITAAIEKVGAQSVGDRPAARIALAYPLDKKIEGKKQVFNEAYFGWIAFEVSASAITDLKTALDANENVLRYMIVQISKDQVAVTLADQSLDVVGAEEVSEEESESGEGTVVGTDTDEAAPAKEEKESE